MAWVSYIPGKSGGSGTVGGGSAGGLGGGGGGGSASNPQLDSLLSQLLADSRVSDSTIQQRVASQMAAQRTIANREIDSRLQATLGSRGLLPSGGTSEQFRTEIALPYMERLAAQEGNLLSSERDRANQARAQAVSVLNQQAQMQMQRQQMDAQLRQMEMQRQQSQLDYELKKLQLDQARAQPLNPQLAPGGGGGGMGGMGMGTASGMSAAFNTLSPDSNFITVAQRNQMDRDRAAASWEQSQRLNGWGPYAPNGVSSAGSMTPSSAGSMTPSSTGSAGGMW